MRTADDELAGRVDEILGVLGEHVLRQHLLDDLPIDELLPHFDDRLGRPSKNLHIVIGVLLLQQLHDLSDAATVEALAFNMTWHHALDVRSEADCYFCEKTLRNYRRLFIAEGLDEVLAKMQESQIRRLPVLNDVEQLVGMLSLGDLAAKSDPVVAGYILADISEPSRPVRNGISQASGDAGGGES